MNKRKKPQTVSDIDTDQMKAMRQVVVEQELSARSHKAYYEKMYYALEAEKLEPLYKEFVERARTRMEEDRNKMEEFIKTMGEKVEQSNEENPQGEITLTPVNEEDGNG